MDMFLRDLRQAGNDPIKDKVSSLRTERSLGHPGNPRAELG